MEIHEHMFVRPLPILFLTVATISTKSIKADFTFGNPQNLGSIVDSPFDEGTPGISPDGLSLYFGSTRPGGFGDMDLWVTTRQTVVDPWGSPVNLTSLNSPYGEAYPSVSPDGLTLYFSDFFYRPDRPGGHGGHDLWMTKRASIGHPWGTPINLGPAINSPADDQTPTISHDSLTLVFSSERVGGHGSDDLWMSTRPTTQQDWGLPINLGSLVNSSSPDYECCLSSDGLALFFMSDRSGGLGGSDAWVTVRGSINDPWGLPVNLGPPVNTSADDGNVAISPDGRMLYFASGRPGGVGGWDLWHVPIIPIVDLNGDGIVDSTDMCIMVDYWSTDNTLCDIGPMPWGDGIVDVEDLKVLANHLFENVNDATLIAHWPLDEAQGHVAYNSVACCDGILMGDPVWQAEGGMVGGALQFGGIDDHVSTDFVLNPADGVFSVVAWIKGGAAGQVLLSQADGSNWLCMNSVGGCLKSDLKNPERGGVSLLSQTSIIDNNWHRIGFVWDGSYRHLYVDGLEVAMDATPLSNLEDAYGGLYFGAGNTLAPCTFFSGLIDDIRIYNRVVSP
jgi:Tol biopolymer transport system component